MRQRKVTGAWVPFIRSHWRFLSDTSTVSPCASATLLTIFLHFFGWLKRDPEVVSSENILKRCNRGFILGPLSRCPLPYLSFEKNKSKMFILLQPFIRLWQLVQWQPPSTLPVSVCEEERFQTRAVYIMSVRHRVGWDNVAPMVLDQLSAPPHRRYDEEGPLTTWAVRFNSSLETQTLSVFRILRHQF